MNDPLERQREHFNKISSQYYTARNSENHLLLKKLLWTNFFKRHPTLSAEVNRVLEPMCGTAEGYRILRSNLGKDVSYLGFDYSENMVQYAKAQNPQISVMHADVTSFISKDDPYDMIFLIGGLHHVYSRTEEVLANLRNSLRPDGLFLSFEPTHNNFVARRARQKIYNTNDLFDSDTEQGFEYSDLMTFFANAGFRKIDIIHCGLLAYIMYYNPDAFPKLNVGGPALVRSIFAIDRLFWSNWIGRRFSFATISLWMRV